MELLWDVETSAVIAVLQAQMEVLTELATDGAYETRQPAYSATHVVKIEGHSSLVAVREEKFVFPSSEMFRLLEAQTFRSAMQRSPSIPASVALQLELKPAGWNTLPTIWESFVMFDVRVV